ncbi:hypothetical protein BaRGS_00001265 [Batillaria attramentaria]|uniref:Uncharacterized protein n=1 Tax=Batillaria attramentaria TaxID=370345 RepID=A0ABD0M760_9CAEN
MSQVGVSRPASHLKMGVNLPDIQHPMSRMSNPDNLDVRGVSRAGDRPASNLGIPNGRPLASENANPLRKSLSAASRRDSRQKNRDGPATGGTIPIDVIPEGVEVKYGDPGATRLPVFGESPSLVCSSLILLASCLYTLPFSPHELWKTSYNRRS